MPLESIRRADFTQGVIHLTKERREYDRSSFENVTYKTIPPFDVLKEILVSGKLKGSGNDGYIKGKERAVCFSEIPLSAVREFANRPSEQYAKYRFYGVALSKGAAFALGARPVVYIPDKEGEWIPNDQKWRQVRNEHGQVDFTHQREWRAKGDVDLTKAPGLFVFVWSAMEAEELAHFDSPVSKLIRSILPMEHLTTIL